MVINMKNILLIGDSIRIGYDKSVKKALEGKANVYFSPENNRFAAYVLRYAHEYKALVKEGSIDVVHWNAGLWDCLHLMGEEAHTPLEYYAYYIDRVCKRLKVLCPDAKFIFATSSSIQQEKTKNRFNKEIEAYNAAAVEIVKKHGHEVNDLYALSVQLPPEAHSDPTHYKTPIGVEAFTNRVLEFVCRAAGIDDVPRYTEDA